MQVFEAKQDFAHVELGKLLREVPLLENVHEELSSCADVKHKVEFVLALESPVQFDEEWVIELLKHVSLAQNEFGLVLFNKLILAKYFNCIQSPCVFLSCKDDATKASSAHDAHLLEVIDADRFLCGKFSSGGRSITQFCIQNSNFKI